MQQMNVLVVGGAGYVGGVVTDLLLDSEHNVRVFDSLLYEEVYRKPVDFIYGDVRDYKTLQAHLAWADAVVWLAALVGDPACALNPDVSVEINQGAVKYLTDHFDGRIVFLSTCSVYGAQTGILTEESPLNPLSIYAATKLESEKYLENKNAIIFRLGTLFGVGDLFSRIRLDLVVNILTVRAFRFGKITVYGGEQFRPLMHVRDAAQACFDNLESSSTGIYNLHKQNVRIIDLAYQVRNHFPDLLIEQTEMKFQDTRNYRVSSDKARDELGFDPVCSIDQGIEEVKSLMESRRLIDVENPRYTNQKYLSHFSTHLRQPYDSSK
jgi:nucleoside-diphosphate-sugar epimerase